MQPALAEQPFLHRGVLDRVEVDFVEPHGRAAPVGGGARHHQGLAGAPGAQGERAVAHEVFRTRPAVAGLVRPTDLGDDVQGHRQPLWHREQLQQKRGGLAQGEAEEMILRRGETRAAEVLQPAPVKVLGANHWVKSFRVPGPERGGQDAFVRGDKIPGGEWLAVGPAGLRAEAECQLQAVGRSFPGLGYAGREVPVGADDDEALAQGAENAGLGDSRDDLRVEVLRVYAHADVEDLR